MLSTIEHRNSRNILGNQIESGLLKCQIKEKETDALTEPFHQWLLPLPIKLKVRNVADFALAKENADERNIEQTYSDCISTLLLELGYGFDRVGVNNFKR